MKVFFVLLPLLILILLTEAGVHTSSTWAVLVAGSNGWENYRHQADVSHAYHTLIKTGLDKDRIIVMMYDDIAYNERNHKKGIIINKPNGDNVYEGVKIDYKGKDVNVDTFKNILLGKKEALKGKGTERVLESGPNDHVFINFVDHGAPGLLSFPDDHLYANDFIQILKQMKTAGKYEKMVLYIEACESGSMFHNLLGPYENILASTAAAPDEPSYSWYCNDGNCLGDLYSITWMERLDKLNFSESLFEQFDAIRADTLQRSHANLYGDYRLGFLHFGKYNINNELTSNVEGSEKIQDSGVNSHDVPLHRAKQELEKVKYLKTHQENKLKLEKIVKDSGVNSRDVPLHIAQKELEKASDLKDRQEKKSKLEKIVKSRAYADNLVSEILQYVMKDDLYLLHDLETNRSPLREDIFDCYKSMVSSFDKECFKVTQHTYFMKHLYKFVNLCANGYNGDKVIEIMEKVCNQRNDLFELIV